MYALSEADAPAFRQELRMFLDAQAPAQAVGAVGRSDGGIPEWARSWQAALFDEGWLVPENPAGLGGRSASETELLVYLEEMALRGLTRSLHYPGYGIVAPTLRKFGSPEQRTFVAPALRGDDIWCVGMSEPDAGSDLSSLRTRARHDGRCLVVEGGKVWTSFAAYADHCLCYVRTDGTASARAGVSVLIVDMRASGVEVHPLRQVTGGADFAEVIFDGVRVPEERLVGGYGDGWRIAIASLGFERRGLWLEWLTGTVHSFRELVALARSSGAMADPTISVELARAYEQLSSLFALGLRGVSQLTDEGLGAHSLLKLAVSEFAVELADLGVRLGYPESIARLEFPGPHGVSNLLRSLGDTIGGGTAEMQRNAIATRMLGLPGPVT